jgi:hypothetical protein
MELTENQLAFVNAALACEDVQRFINDVWWPLYDIWREEGKLPQVEGNPHAPTLLFALCGYPFAVRDGLEEMQNDLDGVIEKLRDDTVDNPWL